jgi:GntR family transcriptional regulator, vanillate catabolism transcriptional regulator
MNQQLQAGRNPRRGNSQTLRAQLALRDWILSGSLPPGERISELSVVERLGVSRTPVRTALVRLEEEGLLQAIPSGGFAVSVFTERDVFDAMELRGTLEGLAARLAAERGVSRAGLEPLQACVAEIDAIMERADFSEEEFSGYIEANARFHRLLAELPHSSVVARQVERASALPFASPSAFVLAQSLDPQARRILGIAQEQHRSVLDAIENREGARAEAIMREHARVSSWNLARVLHSQSTLNLVPGGSLIREAGTELPSPGGVLK